MKPITFPEANQIFRKPEQMTDEECAPLPVHNDGEQLVSCWEMTDEEKLEAVFFGKVWISILGQQQPPIWLATGKTVFQTADDADESFPENFKRRRIQMFLNERFERLDLDSGIYFHGAEDMQNFLLEFLNFQFRTSG